MENCVEMKIKKEEFELKTIEDAGKFGMDNKLSGIVKRKNEQTNKKVGVFGVCCVRLTFRMVNVAAWTQNSSSFEKERGRKSPGKGQTESTPAKKG